MRTVLSGTRDPTGGQASVGSMNSMNVAAGGGIEVKDPALLAESFTLIERRLEQLESRYRPGKAS